MMYMLAYWTCLLLAVDYVQSIEMYLEPALAYTFYEAKDECERRGMQLAILNNRSEYDEATAYIKSINTNVNEVWIGLKMKNVEHKIFEWINGEELQFSPWYNSALQVDPNYIECDSCVRLFYTVTYGWKIADKQCLVKYAYLCTEVNPMQIISLVEGDCLATKYDNTSMKEAQTTTNKDYSATKDAHTATDGGNITAIEAHSTITKDVTSLTNFYSCSCCKVGNLQTYNNYTVEELKIILQPVTKLIRKNLLVNKTTLSSYKNRHICKYDPRKSAEIIGHFGIIVIVLFIVLIILTDVTNVLKQYNANTSLA